MRVLIVDDDVKLAAAIARGLRQEGYAVDVCGDGDAALTQAAVYASAARCASAAAGSRC